MEERVLSTAEQYMKKKIHLAAFGVVLAFISAITYPLFQTFNNAGAETIYAIFEDSLVKTIIVCLVLLAICEGVAGIFLILYTRVQGVPFREYIRLWNVPVSRRVLISAFVAGPGATASILLAVSLCGMTNANIIMALGVLLTPLGAVIFLKERLPIRVIFGICLLMGGVIVASLGPPEDVPNFLLGILIAFIAPIGFAIEALISAKAMDVTEPLQVCALYRQIGGAVFEIIIAVIISLVAFGNIDVISETLSMVFSSGWIMLMLLLTSIMMDFQYGAGYTCFNYCGAARGNTIIQTATIWSIPVGFIFMALGIYQYHVTSMGIIGAGVAMLGVVLVLSRPKDLFNLRKLD